MEGLTSSSEDIINESAVEVDSSPEGRIEAFEETGDDLLVEPDVVSQVDQIKKQQAENRQMEALRAELAVDPMLAKERELIAQDPELARAYREIVENENQDFLREKSAAQVKELEQHFFGPFSIFKIGERRRKKAKLEEFQRFVDGMTPVRADKNDFDEFKSPEMSGLVSSYGAQDTLVRAERYVYGSFVEIGHFMSRGKNQRELDRADIEPRAQIVMNDVANVQARRKDGSFMKKYLTNVFDFENGRKVLALYLASVFDTPDQAVRMIGKCGVTEAQRWDELDLLSYSDPSFRSESAEDFKAQQKREAELSDLFVGRMKDLLRETGLEPPLSLEIRVRDTARVKRSDSGLAGDSARAA